MRVVQIIDNLDWGGAQKMMSLLARELVARQVKVVAIGLDGDDDGAHYKKVLLDYGIDVLPVTGKYLLDLKRITTLIHLMRQGEIDLIQTHLSYANILGVLAGRLAGLPVVVTLHSTGVDRRYYHPVRYRLETLALRCIGCRVVAVGHTVAKTQQMRMGSKKRITVIPNAMTVFPEMPSLERDKFRLALIGRSDGSILISVGRLSPDKGYADMLTAFAMTLQSHPSASLVIVGEGLLADELKLQASSLGIEKNVFFLGARDDVPLLLKASDMYVSASYREGMSMSLLEAMAASLPTVATSVGDAPRMFDEGTGILIQPGNPSELAEAIHSLLVDPTRMHKMGSEACKRVVAEYGLASWVSAYINLYREMLQHNDH